MLDYPLVRTGISIDDALAELTEILGFGVGIPKLWLDKCQFVRHQIDRLNGDIQIIAIPPNRCSIIIRRLLVIWSFSYSHQDQIASTVQRLQQYGFGFGEIVAARVTARTNDP